MTISDVLRHPASVLAAVMLLLGVSPAWASAQTMQVTLAPGDVDVARGLAQMDVELKVSAMEASYPCDMVR